jgi:hypothetical protein
MCAIFGVQSSECALYAAWEKSKKHIHDARMPVPLDEESTIIQSTPDQSESFDLDATIANMHELIRMRLTRTEWEIYRRMFVEGKTEEETAIELGYTKDSGRRSQYKRIRQVRIEAMKEARFILERHGIEGLQ